MSLSPGIPHTHVKKYQFFRRWKSVNAVYFLYRRWSVNLYRVNIEVFDLAFWDQRNMPQLFFWVVLAAQYCIACYCYFDVVRVVDFYLRGFEYQDIICIRKFTCT